jgi:hypothetical protein
MNTARLSIMNKKGEFFEKDLYIVGPDYTLHPVGEWADFVANAILRTLQDKTRSEDSTKAELMPGDFLLVEPDANSLNKSNTILLPAKEIGLVNEEVLLILEAVSHEN